MRYSTSAVPAAKRGDAWQEILVNNCVPFVSEPASRDFEASLDIRAIGRFNCARISQTSRVLARTQREIGQFDANEIFVVSQLCGYSRLEQCGRIAEMAPGSVTVIDSSLPSRFCLEGKNIHLAFHLPKDFVKERGLNWQANMGAVFPNSTGALVSSLMRAAFVLASSQAHTRGNVIAEAIIGLMGASADAEASDPAGDLTRDEEALASIQLYILSHLGDGKLSPESIAAAHRMSGRTLHRIFQQAGVSVCRWIRQNRLDRCAAELRDPTLREQSISEIAFRWGFNDSAHFSNAFRAEFSQSPREYRASADPGVPA